MLTFKHSGALGDIIYSLPTVLSIKKEYKEKSIFCLDLNKPSKNYLGSKHPLRNLRLNLDYFNKLKPLLLQQDYIDEVQIFENQDISVNLDDFRTISLDYSKGHIPRWYFYIFKAGFNLSNPWITVNPNKKFKLLVNRTSRYKNLIINYKFLNDYKPTFIGVEEEYDDFKKEVPNSEFYEAKDFLELAEIIAGAEFFIGNQSFCFSLAEAIKVPRILEVCPFASNVIPHGERAFDFLHQNAFEYIVNSEIK